MKALKLSLLAGAFAMIAGSVAQAADATPPVTADEYAALGFYLRADAGWSFLNWNGGRDDSNWAIGGGAGYRFNDNLRTDLRVDYSGKYSIAPGSDMSLTTVLGNMYFDIPTGTAFTPYLGAGAGYGWGSVKNGSDKNGFTYALMAGATVDLTQNVALDVGYRFREVMAKGSDPMDHSILAGVQFKF